MGISTDNEGMTKHLSLSLNTLKLSPSISLYSIVKISFQSRNCKYSLIYSPRMRSTIGMTLLYSLILYFLQLTVITGIHITYSHTSQEQFSKYVIQDFGLARGGFIDINYDVSISEEHGLSPNASQEIINNAYIQLLITNGFESNTYYSGIGSIQVVSDICAFPSFYRRQLLSSGSIRLNISLTHGQDDQYNIAIMQCRTLSGYYGSYPIDISITADMLNPQPSGSQYSHLPIDEAMVPRVLEGEIIIYALLLLAMIFQFIFSRPYFKAHHHLFALALFCQFLFSISLHNDYESYNDLGYDTNASQYFANVMAHLNSVISLSTLMLISLGWSLTRTGLTGKEFRMVAGTMVVYLTVGLGASVCLNGNAYECQSLYLATYIMRTLLFLGIIVAMNFTVTQLKAITHHSIWTPQLAVQYMLARQYQFFRVAFIIYLLGTTIIFLVQASILTWKDSWMPYMLNEALIIMLYFQMGVNFSPLHEPFATRAFDGAYNAIHMD